VTVCAFCPNKSNITGEHIWSAWIGEILPTTRYVYRRDEGIEKEWSSTKIDQKTNVVCKSCNETWMSNLEGRVKLLAAPLIRDGAPTTLAQEDQLLLAAWAFKHAVISNHGVLEGEPMYTQSERQQFRLSLAVPQHVHIWIAAFQGRSRFSGKFDSRYIRSTDSPPLDDLDFFSHTYVAGHLALQTLSCRWRSLRNRGRGVRLPEQNEYWDPACQRIWPPDPKTISWPSPKYLGEQTIEPFKDRWMGKIEIEITTRR
jgi:hypothetical protein